MTLPWRERPAVWFGVEESSQTRGGLPVSSVQYDGTDESLIATVCRLAGGE